MYFSKTPSFLQKLYPRAIWSSANDAKLQWTFDDGPHPKSTLAILDFLEEHKIKATFFCLGTNVRKYPDLYQKILDAGHQVGNHGFQHISGWSTSLNSYIENIKEAQCLIDSNLFRPAYGRMTRKQNSAIHSHLKMDVVLWSLMPGDFDNKLSREKLADRLERLGDKNSITVLHDEPQAFQRFLRAWSKKEDVWNISMNSRN